MIVDGTLIEAVERVDADLRRLQDCGLELRRPGCAPLPERERSPRSAMMQEADLVLQRADALLPVLIGAYHQGTPPDRQNLRDLFKHCSAFAWGRQGDAMARGAAGTEAAIRDALIVFMLFDGARDPRAERSWLDAICTNARAGRHGTADLLRWAAALASERPRGAAASMQAVLLMRAAEEAAA